LLIPTLLQFVFNDSLHRATGEYHAYLCEIGRREMSAQEVPNEILPLGDLHIVKTVPRQRGVDPSDSCSADINGKIMVRRLLLVAKLRQQIADALLKRC
jgi:hypothetical protein